MSNLTFVTSFHQEGYEKYGKRFLDGYAKHFPKACNLYVFTENVTSELPKYDNIHYLDLLGLNDMTDFIDRWKDVDEVNGIIDNHIDYRYQGVRFSKIIFALTSMVDFDTDWLIRIDSDIIVNEKITIEELTAHLDCGKDCLAHYMGRKDWHHSETSFMAFNMLHKLTKEFLEDFKWMYTSGEVFKLDEYTDSWVFDTLREQGEEQGVYFHNMSKDKPGMDVWEQTWLGEYMEHLKGPVAKAEKTDNVIIHRKDQFLDLIKKFKPVTIVETGTGDGSNAIAMCKKALEKKDAVHYFGFDLFEKHDEKEVMAKLQTFRNEIKIANKKISFSLFKGDTNKTLAQWCGITYFLKDVGNVKIEDSDIAVIGGGDSVETIQNDYDYLKSCKLIFVDHFYSPERDDYGCNSLAATLKVEVLPVTSKTATGNVSIIMTGLAVRTEIPQIIKTQNCLSDPHIQGNVRYSTKYSLHSQEYNKQRLEKEKDTLSTKLVETDLLLRELSSLKTVKWVTECDPHDKTAVLISGAPSITNPKDKQYEANHEKLKALSSDKDFFLFTCKTSHDVLIKKNVIPFGCLLLDPRDHVQDFIENPHSDVKYFTATMCAQTTWNRLLERNAQIWGYHALVGAAEKDVLVEIAPGSLLLPGGSSSITRGLAIARQLGFRKYIIVGQDSCYFDAVDMEALNEYGRKKYTKYTVGGREFVSDPQLVAASQDIERVIKEWQDCEFEVFGDGMVRHVWEIIKPNRVKFIDLINK